MTLQDIDTHQYIGVKADDIHGEYVSKNTKLSYKKDGNMSIYYADFEENYDSEDFTCAGFTFASDTFEYTFGRIRDDGPTNQEQYVGLWTEHDKIRIRQVQKRDSSHQGRINRALYLSGSFQNMDI